MVQTLDGVRILYLDTVDNLLDAIVKQVVEKPDVMVGMSTGGFIVVAMLGKRLGLKSHQLIGLPAHTDENNHYSLDSSFVGLKDGGRWKDKNVYVVDDMSNRGFLLRDMKELFTSVGANATTVALAANRQGIVPDIIGGTCDHNVPVGFWEV